MRGVLSVEQHAQSVRGPMQGVTVAISRRLKPGAEQRFAELAHEMDARAVRFPGHLGSGYIRPATPDGEHVIVYRFDTEEHLDAWRTSPERNELVQQVDELIAAPAHEERTTGLEYWFDDPICADQAPPTRTRQMIITWFGLVPVSFFINWLIVPYLQRVWLLPRVMLTGAVTVVLMTVLVMPALTRLFREYLRPKAG
jgi:uncharacterized protein